MMGYSPTSVSFYSGQVTIKTTALIRLSWTIVDLLRAERVQHDAALKDRRQLTCLLDCDFILEILLAVLRQLGMQLPGSERIK